MPRIIDYPHVLEQMTVLGFKSLYFNSGAFGFTDPASVKVIGWMGPEDSTIRPSARAMARRVQEPYESRLAGMAWQLWRKRLPGSVWCMPMSHWAYELDHGGRHWLPDALAGVAVDPSLLVHRNNGSAIEFSSDEAGPFEQFLEQLLTKLNLTDFMLAFPAHRTLCTVHHHKQLWWMTQDDTVIEAAEALAAENTAEPDRT